MKTKRDLLIDGFAKALGASSDELRKSFAEEVDCIMGAKSSLNDIITEEEYRFGLAKFEEEGPAMLRALCGDPPSLN